MELEKELLMSVLMATSGRRAGGRAREAAGAGLALTAAVLGFFMVTLDAVAVNVALPSRSR